ncbi:MAG TPA: low temperature requirement protein A [Streptosporangiaceae bacterium]
MMRDRTGERCVTNVELFFDLVFVLAVTQLSHFLLSGPGSATYQQTELPLGGHALWRCARHWPPLCARLWPPLS